jgi:hypothetical protein
MTDNTPIKTHVAPIRIDLFIIPYSTVQIGVVGSPPISDQP